MAHDEAIIAGWIESTKPVLKALVDAEPRDGIQRLNGIQALVDEVVGVVEGTLFSVIFEKLGELASEAAGRCPVCQLKCERERKSVWVRTTRRTVRFDVWRYRCRPCRVSRSPVREWLGLKSGMTTAGLDRVMVALSTLMSFGAAAAQMVEQHGHEVDRTLVERRAYAVGKDAVTYLKERDRERVLEVTEAVGVRQGSERVFVQVDSGAVPVGQLERPKRNPEDKTQELTPVRQLPKGRRPKAKREVRVVVAWQPGQVEDKVVNLHVAPRGRPEVTGRGMYVAALEAGMGDNTHVHCTCDMARWQTLQFEEQFGAQHKRSLAADFYHALEYIAAAGKAFEDEATHAKSWLAMQARRLKEGERHSIVADLRQHRCAKACPKTDKDECAVRAAIRYLTRNAAYMDYPRFIAEGLPIGSGEVEGRIRHIVRRRLDVPGDWREDNLQLMTALLTIRHAGWWDDFWAWQDRRDRKRYQKRLLGEGLNRFRGPRKPQLVTESIERLDLDALSPVFQTAIMA